LESEGSVLDSRIPPQLISYAKVRLIASEHEPFKAVLRIRSRWIWEICGSTPRGKISTKNFKNQLFLLSKPKSELMKKDRL